MQFDFPYQLHHSKRARRLNVRISPEKGVQVVIPPRHTEQQALTFLKQHETWVHKHAHVWQLQQIEITAPTEINLPVLATNWNVAYETLVASKRASLLERADYSLVYIGADKRQLKITKLQNWVKIKAESYLTQRLRQLSRECDLPFNDVIFRCQRSVWGTCNRAKNISLNYKLIFLTSEVIDYVLVHELCHTKYLGHGSRFWGLVEKFVPDHKVHRLQLRKAMQDHVPRWFY
jgi:predicted metal-dependent hydrolase